MRKRVYDGFVKVYKDGGFEVVKVTDSVAFLIFIVDMMKVILIRQFRRPMKRRSNPRGLIVEVPAGRFDRRVGVKALVVAEASEEIGVSLSKSDVKLMNNERPLALSPGVLTERMYLAYAVVTSSQMRKGRVFGLKSEGEHIGRVLVSVKKLDSMTFEDMKTFALVEHFLRCVKTPALVKHLRACRKACATEQRT